MKREKLTLAWRGDTVPVPDFVFVEESVPAVTLVAPVFQHLAVPPAAEGEPLDLCLELWKVWMAGDADRDLGAKTMRGLSGEGDGHGPDLHEAQRANDVRIAQATDAMIDSLIRLHVWAIYRSCSQATPWRFPNADFLEVAAEARMELSKKLKNNVCTAVLF